MRGVKYHRNDDTDKLGTQIIFPCHLDYSHAPGGASDGHVTSYRSSELTRIWTYLKGLQKVASGEPASLKYEARSTLRSSYMLRKG